MFEGLNIWKDKNYRDLQGTYPVIFLSFANVKAKTYEAAHEGIIQEILDIYNQNAFLLDCGALTDYERDFFQKVNETMSDVTASRAIKNLSGLLHKYYDKRVIILLDEYDTPMQEAYVNG